MINEELSEAASVLLATEDLVVTRGARRGRGPVSLSAKYCLWSQQVCFMSYFLFYQILIISHLKIVIIPNLP